MRNLQHRIAAMTLVFALVFPVAGVAVAAPEQSTKPVKRGGAATTITRNQLNVAQTITGSLDANDELNSYDSYEIWMNAGEVLYCTLNVDGDPSAIDFDMTAWNQEEGFPVAMAWAPAASPWGNPYPEQMWVAADVSGYYDIDVEAWEGAANYTLTADFVTRTPAAVSRIAGADRYVVAVEAAKQAFPGWAGITDVIIACGDDRAAADPLAAAGMAGAYKAPVLLTKSILVNGKLPTATENAISQIRAANGGKVNIHVIGGTTSVPAAVYNRASTLKGTGGTIERINAADRYTLSVTMAKRAQQVKGSAVPFVLIANGETTGAFYDALAASPISYYNVAPTILVRKAAVPASVSTALSGTFSTAPRLVVNSLDWVNGAVYSGVKASDRIASDSDRYYAAVEIAWYAVGHKLLTPHKVAVTNKLPDALTGGVALGQMGGTILYTNGSSIDYDTADRLFTEKGAFDNIYVIGGTASVTDGAKNTITAYTRY